MGICQSAPQLDPGVVMRLGGPERKVSCNIAARRRIASGGHRTDAPRKHGE